MIHDLRNVAQLVFIQLNEPQSVALECIGNRLDRCGFACASISGEEDVGAYFPARSALVFSTTMLRSRS